MKRYYARGGGLTALQRPMQAPPAQVSYYTYGQVPPEIWPMRNDPPLTQAQEDEEAQLLGEDPAEAAFAQGGIAEMGPLSVLSGGGAAPRAEGPVAGPGTGRSDEIDARLSDGEYVVDAEAVALIGDGSTAAGADALDRMIEQIRAHKGKALAKGKFSPAALSPLDYLMGAE